ncbi:MAG: pre-peptidase C-terminal domain-containing protein, partial [Prevotellaceae bacterium]|nr:pre-peptidase C-terminal domain-containing protein [Prevotellaceae bacterium]
MAAGTYYVVSETYNATSGVIQTTIKTAAGENMQTPINAGTFSADFQYTNSQNLEDFTNSYTGRSTNDIFYKFTLTKSMSIVINHCGSAVDTYLHLLDASGNSIGSNDDYSGEGACSNTYHSYLRKNLAAGTYYVVSETFSATSGVIQTTIVGMESESKFGYPDIPDAYSADLVAVGGAAATLDVSATGAATYTIPIEVPPGVGGMQPSLAIAYNSQSGNGVAGWGCNLAGVSAITCAPKSVYYDGTAKGLTRLGDEAYLLDGQRLVLYSGAAGQNGAVYCPEADPFTRVTMKGSCTSTACSTWFEVLTKDGVK